MLNEDYKDILHCLQKAKAEFLLVGGYALAAHGYPRATKDIDLWIWANPENAKKVMQALQEFGAPIHQVSEDDFAQEGIIYQIGVSPRRIDIKTQIDGVKFNEAYPRRITVTIDELEIPVISREDLIECKKTSARPQDLVDVALLEKR